MQIKSKLLIFFLIISTGSFWATNPCQAQSMLIWQAPVSVGINGQGNQMPRIVLDRNNNPMIIWGNSVRKEVLFSRWDGGFSPALAINPSWSPAFTSSWAGPHISSFGDTIYIVYKMMPEDSNNVYLLRSFDGGRNFLSPVAVDNIGDSLSRFPTVTTDDNGQPQVAFMRFASNFSDPEYVFTKSTDYGASFGTHVQASGHSGGEACDCCQASLISDGNRRVLLYRDNLSNIRTIWAAVSHDNGITFPDGVEVDPTGWHINACPSSGPDGIIIGDSLYTVWMSGANGNTLSYFTATSLSTYLSGPTIPITGNFTGINLQNYPRIAKNGNAVAVVCRQTSNTGYGAVHYTSDIYNGLPTIFDTATVGNILNADVALSPGKVHVVWQDNATGTVRYRSADVINTAAPSSRTTLNYGLFPNPASEIVTLEFNTTIPPSLALLNAGGYLLQLFPELNPGTNKFEINLKNLSPGIYFLKITDKEGTVQVLKIIRGTR